MIEGNAEVGAGAPEVLQEGSATEPLDFCAGARLAFGRFVELMRRNQGLTPEELAARADVDLQEIVSIEGDVHYTTEPRTIYQLARAFALPEKRLMQLAGLAHAKDPHFTEEAVLFAARSESVEKLNVGERKALESFIALLSSKE